MSPERWQHVKRLLAQAMQLSAEERPAWLDEVCADDQALRQDLETLLRADADPMPMMDAPLESVAMIMPEIDQPTHIGPYQILKMLGRGGMGVVYLAERTEISKQVALKVMATGRNSPEYMQRFLMERRVLARLQHPNIAQLLDIGVTEQGLPYFVMEYVVGEPITSHCDAHRFDITERLHLFLTVCEAVQYAHSNLVIHRDLKPSNILVRRSDQTTNGTTSSIKTNVKLLDFGIAKLLEKEPDQPDLTQTGMRVMTPTYASPEQVRGAPISTASDVYSLGVLLYELLTGHRPYHVEGRRPTEIEQIVCETDPIKPSIAVTQTGPATRASGNQNQVSPESIAVARRTRQERLQKQLRGDLDTIILKALRKEPNRRYRSVEQFMEDVRRHLDGIPIQACPSTIRYRVGKFVTRHRVGVAMTALFVVILIGIVSLFTFQIANERDRAQQEAAKAEQVKDFMVDVFRSSDPEETRGDTITARELLERSVQRIEAGLDEQSAVQADMLDAIGRVYFNLGQLDRAIPLLEQALNVRRLLYGPEHVAIASSLDILGQVLYGKGNYEAAEPLLQSALEMRQRLLGAEQIVVGASANNLALVAQAQGNLDRAEALLQQSLTIGEAVYGSDDPRLATDYHNLALLLEKKGQYAEAKPFYEKALQLDQATHGEAHPHVATDLHSLARLLYLMGDLDSALVLNQTVLKLYQQFYTEAHPSIGNSLHNQALVLHSLGRLDEAEAMFLETRTLEETVYGKNAPIIAITLKNLALVYCDKGQQNEADQLIREALHLQRVLPERHPRKAGVQIALGTLRLVQQRHAEAETAFRKALAIRVSLLSSDHWQIAEVQSSLGYSLVKQNKFEEAKTLLQSSYDVLNEKLGPHHQLTQKTKSRRDALYKIRNEAGG